MGLNSTENPSDSVVLDARDEKGTGQGASDEEQSSPWWT